MLTVPEINEIQGLLKYLEQNLHHLKPDDITLIDSNGEQAAVVAYDGDGGSYVLKEAPVG
jgi:hypothetical protein